VNIFYAGNQCSRKAGGLFGGEEIHRIAGVGVLLLGKHGLRGGGGYGAEAAETDGVPDSFYGPAVMKGENGLFGHGDGLL
jgi:hypothetical protein